MTERQCSSCGGFCKRSGCERENVKRLADELDGAAKAAAELRRLHMENADLKNACKIYGDALKEEKAINDQLLEALARLVGCIDHGSDDPSSTLDVARAAIAAAKEMK